MAFTITSQKKCEMLDITKHVGEIVADSGVREGIVSVFALHATAAVIINENWDPNICTDILTLLAKLIPDHDGYRHDTVDGNAASHIKAAILGPGETVPVRNGKLQLGRWQAVMLVELDGPRERTVEVTVVGS